MRGFVAVTDMGWYEFLASRQPLDEVNFWQPRGATPIRNLSVGEPFLFKLRAPTNAVVGVGYFTTFSALPLSLAWDAFREKNGVESLREMQNRLARIRGPSHASREDYTIGCVVLTAPCFFPRDSWIPVPNDYPINAVRGKTYDLASQPGLQLWITVTEVARRTCGDHVASGTHESAVGFAYGEVLRRLGQGGFRILVTETYNRRCAVTREKTLPVLDAAHIKPVSAGGTHGVSNGLLLRSDVHTLFDRGYITINPNYRVEVSRRLKADFDNGRVYYALTGSEISLPSSVSYRPDRESLEWHADSVFLR